MVNVSRCILCSLMLCIPQDFFPRSRSVPVGYNVYVRRYLATEHVRAADFRKASPIAEREILLVTRMGPIRTGGMNIHGTTLTPSFRRAYR